MKIKADKFYSIYNYYQHKTIIIVYKKTFSNITSEKQAKEVLIRQGEKQLLYSEL